MSTLNHTAGLDTIFVQIYMDVLPGVPGVSKNQFFLHIKLLSFCANIAPKRHKLRKTIKIEKNVKKPLFSESILNLLHFGGNISAPNLK